MKKTILSAALVAVMGVVAFAPQNAKASDGTITFNGKITAQTCTISGNGGPASFTVQLPTVSTSSLTAAKETAGATPFNIALTACSPDSGNVSTYFEAGSTIDTVTGNLLNATGSATNVEVGLLNSDSSVISLGKAQAGQNSATVAIASGAATLNYIAQYVATNGAAGAGTVASTVTYSMSYQ
ncbi:MAG: fimbrial protein [Rhodanobacter sp.]